MVVIALCVFNIDFGSGCYGKKLKTKNRWKLSFLFFFPSGQKSYDKCQIELILFG